VCHGSEVQQLLNNTLGLGKFYSRAFGVEKTADAGDSERLLTIKRQLTDLISRKGLQFKLSFQLQWKDFT
jgi:hypothetical protein